MIRAVDYQPADLERITFVPTRAEELRGAVAPQLVARVSLAGDAVAARSGDQVVGLVASVPAQGQRDLVAWWVDPQVRGRGVGGVLLRWVLDETAPGSVRVAAPSDEDVATIVGAYGFEPGDNGTWRSPFGVIRQAVRAIVTDPHDRVALVRFDIGGVRFWNLPGGGIERGETTKGALVRELHEELGLVLSQAVIGPLAWHQLHWWTKYRGEGAQPFGQLERVHSVQVPTIDLEPAIGWAGLAAESVIDLAWWHLDDLAVTADRFATAELPGRIVSVVASTANWPDRSEDRFRLGAKDAG